MTKSLQSCGGLPALQLGHTALLCVKVRVRTIHTLSFGDRKVPAVKSAADCVVRLEISSNWGMAGFSETCKRLFASVKFREVCSLQRNPMLPIFKSVRIQSFPKKKGLSNLPSEERFSGQYLVNLRDS